MAPETFTLTSGRQLLSASTDVYMFGCLILEVISGRAPFWWLPSGSALAFQLRMSTGTPPHPLHDAPPHASAVCVFDCPRLLADLHSLVAQCVCPDPTGRPDMPDVLAALVELEARYGGHGIDTSPVRFHRETGSGYSDPRVLGEVGTPRGSLAAPLPSLFTRRVRVCVIALVCLGLQACLCVAILPVCRS